MNWEVLHGVNTTQTHTHTVRFETVKEMELKDIAEREREREWW